MAGCLVGLSFVIIECAIGCAPAGRVADATAALAASAAAGPVPAPAAAHQILLNTTSSASNSGWRIQKRGLYYVIASPGRFSRVIPSREAQEDGWNLEESCAARARFVSTGKPGTLTIYADGRTYLGGNFISEDPSMIDAVAQARQHESPSEVRVEEAMGRIDRSTRGDANNDGYNETWGVYELRAAGRRIEFTICPRTHALSRPMIEIAGLPPGGIFVTMEGRLLTSVVRLKDGHVLIEIPGTLQRPTTVNAHIE